MVYEMKVLITGAAGNLGGFLTRYLLPSAHRLRLMAHRTPVPGQLVLPGLSEVVWADLGNPSSLPPACQDIDCIVHFAGELFTPRPATFLQRTNVDYVKNLVEAAVGAGVGKFILISFPHVEGESSPEKPASGGIGRQPDSIHARTRKQAELLLLERSRASDMVPVILRPGMIYGRGVLMIEAGRRLSEKRLLAVWPDPTWIHLLSLPDFNRAVKAAIEGEGVQGIYNLGDEMPMTLQDFLDRVTRHWGHSPPWRFPPGAFYAAAAAMEGFALLFNTPSPLTRDFIRIGRASYSSSLERMYRDLLPNLHYPNLDRGLVLL